MTRAHGFSPDADTDASFERWLLDSAHADAVPAPAVREAWARFAAAAGAVAVTTSLAAPTNLWTRLARSTGMRWLLAGAVGGSALTALVIGQRPTPSAVVRATPAQQNPDPSPPPTAQPAAAALPAASANGDRAAPAEIVRRAERPRARRDAPPQSANPGRARGASEAAAPPASSAPPALSAEILALDAVRAATAAGTIGRALRLVDQYHRDFPGGQLAAEAEVLAIEALKQDGETAEAARRAAQFLRKYPNDPQSARIESLVTPSP